MNTETQAPPELLTLGPWGIAAFTAITITVLVLGYLMVRGKNKAVVLILAALGMFALAGCGSFSQARVDDLENAKRNHAQDVERAMQDKLSAVELRGSLASIDTALLAEFAHRGAEADLEAERVRLEAASDAMVAGLFNGDTGR